MSRYTIAIHEKLSQHKLENESFQDLDVMLRLAKEHLFGDELEVIDPLHRDHFALGFALHYFYDEIGLENWFAWQMMLKEKIYNNSSYINLMYEHLDKQVFSNYRIRKVDSNDEVTGNSQQSIENANERSGNVTNLINQNVESNDSTTTSSENTDNRTSDQINKQTSNQTDSTSNLTETNETSTHENDSTNTHTGTNDVIDSGKSNTTGLNTTTTDQTTTDNRTVDVDGSSSDNVIGSENSTTTTENDSRTRDLFSDTPQSGLSQVFADGGGNYLTNARQLSVEDTGESTVAGSSTNNTTSKNESLTKENGSSNVDGTSTSNVDDETITSGTSKTTVNNSDITADSGSGENIGTNTSTGSNISDSLVDGTVGIIETGGTIQSGESGGESSSTSINDSVGTSTGTETGTTENTSLNNSLSTGHIEEESYELNHEVLMRSASLLNNVWYIFDEIFMGVY